MTTPIVFPDVELWAVGRLQAQLPDYGYTLWSAASPSDSAVFVSNERDTQKTAVWVRRDGGPQLDIVREAPRLGINVFAPTKKRAGDLARIVSAILRAGADGNPVTRATQPTGPTPIPDATGPRLYLVVELNVRGTHLNPTP